MPEETSPEARIAALEKELEALKERMFVLEDKASQALIAGEAQSALVFALIAQSKDRKFLLDRFQYMCAMSDKGEINQRRTDFERQFQAMFRQNALAHLQQK